TLPSGAGGSMGFFAAYLNSAFPTQGEYYIEVTSLIPGYLPKGTDYALQVSLQGHKVDGFVFGAEPVAESETEQAQNGGVQNVDDASKWFTFFDLTVGNTDYTGGGIDFLVPYAKVTGSGDNTPDMFKFTVTTAMLATTSGSIVTSTPASGDYFTQALLRLDGRTLDGNGVTAGDKWSLGLRYHTYEYTAMAGDDLLKVAFGLAKDIGEDTTNGSRFTVGVIKTATDVFLGIADPAGFNIHGLKLVNGAVVTTAC